MKKIVLPLMMLLAFPSIAADDGLFKEGVKDTVSNLITLGKDAISGAKDGVDEGRKSGSSIDGATIIADKETLVQYVQASVSSVEKVADQQYKVSLALRNTSDKTVRLINLLEQRSLLLLDNDGFVSNLQKSLAAEIEVTIPEKSAVRVRYVFGDVEGVPTTLRIYGMDFAVPAVKTH